jgi:hypothetical protein
MCNVETLEPCNMDDCDGIIEIDNTGFEDDEEECFFCIKVDCICDEMTDRYKERDLF